ncbi:hypothetical protein DXV75_00595 [Alteromonas aestuariivivens]|uniref:Uncharacterized protein n=2 Tax=Alteromonas aestuariivivens TaxID=1938339 RepID=A0A3D8MEM2_9ALTE|nr:hypothetical protein DXV75_00595 [Alteromonas aestuariivivens]
MVDVYKESNDNGVYELVYPVKEASISLQKDHLYGFDYNIAAPKQTPFKLFLDDEVLVEGKVGESGYVRGSGVL